MTTPAVDIKVQLDKEQAQTDAQKLSKEIMGALLPITGAASAVGFTLATLGKELRAVADFAVDSVAIATKHEVAEQALAKTLELRAGKTRLSMESLRDFNRVLAEKSLRDQDEILGVERLLVDYGVLPHNLQLATEATIGLAESGKGLSESAMMVNKLVHGQTGVMRELGMATRDPIAAQRQLAAEAQVAGGRLNTLAGEAKQLEVAWHGLQRELGEQVTKNKEVNGFVSDLTSTVKELADTAAANKDPLADFVSDVFGGMRSALAGIRENKTEAVDAIKNMATSLAVSAGPMGLVVPAYRTAATLLEKIKKEAQELVRDILPNVAGARGMAFGATPIEPDTRSPPIVLDPVVVNVGKKPSVQPDIELIRQHQLMRLEAQREYAEKMMEYYDKWTEDLSLAADREVEVEANKVTQIGMWLTAEREMREYHAKEMAGISRGMVEIGIQGTAQLVSGMTQAIVSGEGDLLGSFGRLFGRLMVQEGEFLVGQGILFGLIGAVTGNGFLLAKAAAMTGAGIGLIAAGSAIGGTGGGGKGSNAPNFAAQEAAREGQTAMKDFRRMGNGTPAGFVGMGAAAITTVINIHFSSGVVMGTPRQVARAIEDTRRRGDTLRIGGP